MTDDDESWLREIAKTPIIARGEDLSGTSLGRYRIDRVLGRGGMGVVYRASDEQLGRVVALKVLPAESVGDDQRRRRFLREARIAARLVDPSIATVFDAGEAEGRVFLAMEYVEGRTLRSELREHGRLPLAEAVRVAVDTARALARAHEAGVVHRDVKPDNVMLAKNGGVKVLDFGVAKLDEPRDGDPQESWLETRAGALVGTPAYMSPEQAKGSRVDARSDVFSFGVLLYELVAGTRPFEGATPLDVLIAIDRDEPAPLARVRDDVPRWLDTLVRRCLAKDPVNRPKNAREVLVALSERPLEPRRSKMSRRFVASAIAIATGIAFAMRVRRPADEVAPHAPTPTVAPTPTRTVAPPPTVAESATPPPGSAPPTPKAAHAAPRTKPTTSSSAARAATQPGPLDEPK